MSLEYIFKQYLQLYSRDEPILFRFEQFEQALVVLYSSIKLYLHPLRRHLYFNLVLN